MLDESEDEFVSSKKKGLADIALILDSFCGKDFRQNCTTFDPTFNLPKPTGTGVPWAATLTLLEKVKDSCNALVVAEIGSGASGFGAKAICRPVVIAANAAKVRALVTPTARKLLTNSLANNPCNLTSVIVFP
jgi:hypothetical protein